MKSFTESVFRAYDIRGIAGEELTTEFMKEIGQAFGTFVRQHGGKVVVLGRDIRWSSPEYLEAVKEGLISTGCVVKNMGITMTPIMYYASQREGIDGGLMITSSHNPGNYNGLKIRFAKASLPTKQIMELKDMVAAGKYVQGDGHEEDYSSINQEYVKEIVNQAKLDRQLKVVVDPSSSAGAFFIRDVLQGIGAEVVMINDTIDPDFKLHEPDPVPLENYSALSKAVVDNRADIGVMLDGDADRVGFVDENGKVWLGDQIMMLLVRDIVPKHPGGKVIVELKNSEGVIEEIKRLGGEPILWMTGHTLIDLKLLEEKAIMAAEQSCHYWLADEWYDFDDSFYAVSRVLRILASGDQKFSEIMSALPYYPATPEYRVKVPADRQLQIVQELVDYFKGKCDRYIDLDGIRGYIYDGWFLVRSSNTQPVITLRVEGKTEAALEKIKAFVKAKLDEVEGVDLDWNRQVDKV
jgi:phosphomannomutase / phosphoglucomutase